jgi:hypothetical protein
VDITNQLSRERTAIRVLFELLTDEYRSLKLGQLLPCHGLFDVIFKERGLLGSGRHRTRELEAVHKTYYEDMRPAILKAFPCDEAGRARAEVVVKTILLCQLTRDFRGDMNIGRIVNLNPHELRGKRRRPWSCGCGAPRARPSRALP